MDKLTYLAELAEGLARWVPERERQVIYLRYFKGLTQDKTAKILAVSQVQVSRLEKKILRQMREYLER